MSGLLILFVFFGICISVWNVFSYFVIVFFFFSVCYELCVVVRLVWIMVVFVGECDMDFEMGGYLVVKILVWRECIRWEWDNKLL